MRRASNKLRSYHRPRKGTWVFWVATLTPGEVQTSQNWPLLIKNYVKKQKRLDFHTRKWTHDLSHKEVFSSKALLTNFTAHSTDVANPMYHLKLIIYYFVWAFKKRKRSCGLKLLRTIIIKIKFKFKMKFLKFYS